MVVVFQGTAVMLPSAHLLQCFSLCIVTVHFLREIPFLHLKFNMMTVIVKVLSYKNGANDMSDTMLIVAEIRPNKVKGTSFILKHWLHGSVLKNAFRKPSTEKNSFFL